MINNIDSKVEKEVLFQGASFSTRVRTSTHFDALFLKHFLFILFFKVIFKK